MRSSRFLPPPQYVRGSAQIAEVLCTFFPIFWDAFVVAVARNHEVCRSWERGVFYIRYDVRMLLLQVTVIFAEIVYILVKRIVVLEDQSLVAHCRVCRQRHRHLAGYQSRIRRSAPQTGEGPRCTPLARDPSVDRAARSTDRSLLSKKLVPNDKEGS